MEKITEEPKINFVEQRVIQRRFLQKTTNLMYVLVFLSVCLAVFFYTITIGSKLFVIGLLLFIALLGVITARDARVHLKEIDAFDLFYGINKIKNDKKKEI